MQTRILSVVIAEEENTMEPSRKQLKILRLNAEKHRQVTKDGLKMANLQSC